MELERRVLCRFARETLPTVGAPKRLFHGTQADLIGPPKGPAWLTPHEAVAESYATEDGSGTVYTYLVQGSPKLLSVGDDVEAKAVLDALGIEVHPRMRPAAYFTSSSFSRELSQGVCRLGFDGWLFSGRGSGRVEVMLCSPARFLSLVAQRPVD